MNGADAKLIKNPVQYFATIGQDGKAKVRYFQFMIEGDGKIWFCTNSTKIVYKEMQANPYIELCISAPSFAWVRLNGKAVFKNDIDVKTKCIEASPLVKNIYQTADSMKSVS